jgi:prepilin-type N-terminal cleavage/methylation domain-containing protein
LRELTLAIFFPNGRKTVTTPTLFGAPSEPRFAALAFRRWLVRILPSRKGMIRKCLERAHGSGGFTLTEMVVALSIAGVVAALAVPASGKLLDRYRLSSALSQVKMEVTRARMQAVGQNRWVRLNQTSTDSFAREVSSNGTTFTQDGNAMPLPKGVQMGFGLSGRPKFNRQGLASESTYVVVFNSQGIRILWVNVLGRVEAL